MQPSSLQQLLSTSTSQLTPRLVPSPFPSASLRCHAKSFSPSYSGQPPTWLLQLHDTFLLQQLATLQLQTICTSTLSPTHVSLEPHPSLQTTQDNCSKLLYRRTMHATAGRSSIKGGGKLSRQGVFFFGIFC